MKAIVLAAGKGKRLNSEKAHLPKVMREAAGRPLLSYVLENISFIPHKDTVIVVGYMADTVRAAFPDDYRFVMQSEQLGTRPPPCRWPRMNSQVIPAMCWYALAICRCSAQDTFKELFRKHAESGAAVTLLTRHDRSAPGIRPHNTRRQWRNRRHCGTEGLHSRTGQDPRGHAGRVRIQGRLAVQGAGSAQEQQCSGRVLPD